MLVFWKRVARFHIVSLPLSHDITRYGFPFILAYKLWLLGRNVDQSLQAEHHLDMVKLQKSFDGWLRYKAHAENVSTHPYQPKMKPLLN